MTDPVFDAAGFALATGGVAARGPQEDISAYCQGARGEIGKAAFVMFPRTTQDVRACLIYCHAQGLAVVPQSGNTGLVGGSVPDRTGIQAVLSFEKMTGVCTVDPRNRSATVSAGIRLSDLNAEASKHGLCFPIDLGADPMIGGMVATNTGGARYLRFGGVRHRTMGLTAVLNGPEAPIVQFDTGLRKNNTGPDLKQLLIGTAGQFGMITEATLELCHAPRQQAVALVVPSDEASVIELLLHLEERLGPLLSAFELMSGAAMQHGLTHASAVTNPFPRGEVPETALLIEVSRGTDPVPWETDLDEILQMVLAEAMDPPRHLVSDALFGPSEKSWALRHTLSGGVKSAGRLCAFDLSFRRQDVMEFRRAMRIALADDFPGVEICDFGHVGDGGLHFNLLCPEVSDDLWPDYELRLRDFVITRTIETYGGSFSAEHGIGPKNRHWFEKYQAAAVKDLTDGVMQGIHNQSEWRADKGVSA